MAGQRVLASGGVALDAVQAAVIELENAPIFNAGVGAVLNHDGQVELDAAIMDGRDLRAGAVASVTRIGNPIVLARAVMDRSPHVLLVGTGAERFAQGCQFEFVHERYHVTEQQLANWLQDRPEGEHLSPKGTVGAVALDERGNLAAATSTGGISRKLPGRVGDSPLIGAGTYAENGVCAVSATGDGEYIMRIVAAHEVARLISYRGLGVTEACTLVVREKVAPFGGEVGLIALDADGNAGLPFHGGLFFRGAWFGDDALLTGVAGSTLVRR
jgi:beta-aspartyl-peptidase (threonine type)